MTCSHAPSTNSGRSAARTGPGSRNRRYRRSPSATLSRSTNDWLHLNDPEPLYVCWGAIAANRLPGEPVSVQPRRLRRRKDRDRPRVR